MSLDEYRAFVRVVEDGSFTAAARSLGVSKSFVSKQISRLEDRLGVRLLNRTTRQVTPTDAGNQFHKRALAFLGEIEEAEAEAQQASASPRGTLRVSLPMSFGLRYLSPLLAEFLEANQEVRIDADYSDRKVDVVAEAFDVAVRIGALADSSLVGKKLAPMSLHVLASPEYWETHPRPQNPAELAEHEVLLYRYISANHTQSWDFKVKGGQSTSVRVSGRLLANAGEALRDAAISGLGVARLPDFLVCDAIEGGVLEPVLEEWRNETGAIWAIFPHNRHVSTTVRLFVDFLADRLKAT
ncbi:MAG: DNA-binding transcriptional LysR family regulator [Bradymonadia bacterium]|jgi:DNA-binding transcriptional LysR family regulator